MSALSIRRELRRHRRRLTVIAAALALAGVITAHHSGLPMNAHYDMEMSAVAELCLGVFAAVGAALAAAGLVILALGRWRPALFRIPAVELPARPVPRRGRLTAPRC